MIKTTVRSGTRPVAGEGRGNGRELTHHTDGEVVVDDVVGHRVPLGLLRVRHHLHAPAVHQHGAAGLQGAEDATQVHPIVPWRGGEPERQDTD